MNQYIKTLYIPIGPAGCGKTSYRQSIERGRAFAIASADVIRHTLLNSNLTHTYFDAKIEPQVWTIFWKEFEAYLGGIMDIFVDNTNLSLKRRYHLVSLGRKAGFKIHMIWLNIPLGETMRRNRTRDAKVPDKEVARQYSMLYPPQPWEYDTMEEITQ